MKRSRSIQDLFGSSDSDVDSDTQLITSANVNNKTEEKPSRYFDSKFSGDSGTQRTLVKRSDKIKQNLKVAKNSELGKVESGESSQTVAIHEMSKADGEIKHPENSAEPNKSSEFEGKPICQYGKRCYRKNPSHFKEFDHPGGSMFSEELQPLAKKQRTNEGTNTGSTSSRQEPAVASSIIELSQPYSFLVTKVHGIDNRFNSVMAVGIQDLLSPTLGNLQKSAQFNYCIDIPWLVSQYPVPFRCCPLLIVYGAKGGEKIALQECASQFDHIRLCQAPLEIPYGTHHTKMMLLLYDAGLRIVVHTANLVREDWAQKTQGVWVSPLFPKLPSGDSEAGDSVTHFRRDLIEYLSAYRQRGLDEWVTTIRQFDFSSAKVVLVGSVPGRHSGEKKSHFGHLKLRKVLQDSGPNGKAVSSWPVIGQFSSVGSLGSSSDAWLTSEWLPSLSSVKGLSSEKAKLQLVYPSKENVRRSLEGYAAGGALPYSINTAVKQPYFNAYLHQWKATSRGRSLASPHIKTYTRASSDGSQIAWFLLTSANLSKAAWGSLEKNGIQLLIRSYELGVLFLPQHFQLENFLVENSLLYEENIMPKDGCSFFPFPYDLPPTPYSKDDKPWIWDVAYTDLPDRHGNMWSPS